MDEVDGAVLDVGALDEIVELALAQAGLEPVAQAGHAEIGEMRADAQPVDLLFRLDQPVAGVGLVEILRRAELRGDHRVLLGGQRPDGGDAVAPARRALSAPRPPRAIEDSPPQATSA